MTLKKSISNRGQSIFEYFILTTAVVAVVLFFAVADSDHFNKIKASCENAFIDAVDRINGKKGGGSTTW